jgi:hypothetical protein
VLFAVRCSLLAVRCSLFAVRYSLFATNAIAAVSARSLLLPMRQVMGFSSLWM